MGKKMMAGRVLFTALTVGFVLFIFSRSLYDGDASGQQSGAVLRWLHQFPGGVWQMITEHFIRKLAHFCEYAVLGILLAGTVYTYRRRPWEKLFLQLFLLLSTAAADEWLQTMVPGRCGAVGDVWLDFFGAAFGCMACLLMLFLRNSGRRSMRVIRRGGCE